MKLNLKMQFLLLELAYIKFNIIVKFIKQIFILRIFGAHSKYFCDIRGKFLHTWKLQNLKNKNRMGVLGPES